jgi:hypothetical protein
VGQLADHTIVSLQVTFSVSLMTKALNSGVRVVSALDIERLLYHGMNW